MLIKAFTINKHLITRKTWTDYVTKKYFFIVSLALKFTYSENIILQTLACELVKLDLISFHSVHSRRCSVENKDVEYDSHVNTAVFELTE